MNPMKRIVGVTSIIILCLTAICLAQDRGLSVRNSSGERRVALIVGIGAYETAPLRNAVNDARDMAQALRDLGFDVVYQENLNQNDLKRSIRGFSDRLRDSDIALFYYAGHGVQVKGVNYLVPTGAQLAREEEVEYECVDAGFVFAAMENAPGTKIVILDACRNNPFARSFRSASRGLATMTAPGGTLVAYATSPGSVASDGDARNGLYTQELLKFMRYPGLSIEEVFKRVRVSVLGLTQGKQTPWESSSLIGEFYFVKPGGSDAASTNSAPAPVRALNIDEFNGSSFGLASGVVYTDAVDGQGAVFSRKSESRIQYPIGIPSEGTLEWWINVKSGYGYKEFKLAENQYTALIFTTDAAGGDVTWPGSTWLHVSSDGTITLKMATVKYEGRNQILTSQRTNFRFNQWHSIGVSFGSEGQHIMLDGVLVASAPQNKQKLGRGGHHDNAIDIPTIGESVSGYWANNQWDGGFEGIVDRFRISTKQKDWLLSAQSLEKGRR